MRRVLFSIGPVNLYGYGLMIAIGIICGFAAAGKLAKKQGLDPDGFFNMGVTGLVSGLAGAKLLYIIVELPSYIENPKNLLMIGEGFVIYGGVICGALAVWLYAKKKGMPVLTCLDCAAVGMSVGQCFGRMGCLLAGCCYGKETSCAFSVTFPADSLAPPGVPLVPTQLIMAAGDALLALILFLMLEKSGENERRRPGKEIAAYLILYSAGRFAVEFFRGDLRGSVGPLSTSQFIACFTAAAGIALMVFVCAGAKKEG